MDINDLRRLRAQAATNLRAAADAIATAESGLTALGNDDTTAAEQAVAAAVADFDAAQATFDRADAAVRRAEAVESAAAVSATQEQDAPPAGRAPATVASEADRGLDIGFAVHALTNARGNLGDACAALDAAGHSGISAALTGAQQTAGGVLLPRPQAETVIELLRPRVTVRASGARVMPMPAGQVRHGAQTGSATAGYGVENGAAVESEQSFDGIDQGFKTLRALVPVGNALLRHSTAAVAAIVRDDLLSVMATREDLAFLRDIGANATPYGLKYWTPVANWLDPVGVAPAAVEAAIRRLVSLVEDANVTMQSPGWIMRASTKNFLAGLRDPNSGALIFPSIDQNGTLKGFPIRTTSQIPNNLGVDGDETEVYFADFNEVMIGDAMSLTIATSTEAAFVNQAGDTVSAFQNDLTLMRAISEHDLAPRHTAALSGLNGKGWAI
ncbi:phage capsid protein [Loktanella sp. 3ANDIMAR09]|uniref:phage major capsid protein n=1 Tax=Loktanella sp. 3ANDIMAR09 TaxID=1225657 RepID=UPI0006F52770|nr:phage major capsid protein [Loktanella sp. 3ANDIMAR09]KQI66961.1 phage capsid protein [Loktanella sp. 3ANDIMAR09]